MKTGRVLIAAVLFLGVGLWLVFANCDGTTGLNFGYPLSACKLTLDITTTGVPVLVGIPMAGFGSLLMLIAFVAAIVAQFRGSPEPARKKISARREAPFEEVDPE
jgi:hypothetical protein